MEKTNLTIDLEFKSGELDALPDPDTWLERVTEKIVALVREQMGGESACAGLQVRTTVRRPAGIDSGQIEDLLDALAVAIITRDDPALLSWARAELDRRGKFGLSRPPGQDERRVDQQQS